MQLKCTRKICTWIVTLCRRRRWGGRWRRQRPEMSLEDLGILILASSYSYLGGGFISLDDDAETEAGHWERRWRWRKAAEHCNVMSHIAKPRMRKEKGNGVENRCFNFMLARWISKVVVGEYEERSMFTFHFAHHLGNSIRFDRLEFLQFISIKSVMYWLLNSINKPLNTNHSHLSN